MIKCPDQPNFRYDYSDVSSTATIRWDTVCDQAYQQTFDTQSFMIGKLLGAFIFGGIDYYRGDYVMEYDDVILVTVQYRLNAFGFISSEDESLPGNYGSLDQVEALRYLKKKSDPLSFQAKYFVQCT